MDGPVTGNVDIHEMGWGEDLIRAVSDDLVRESAEIQEFHDLGESVVHGVTSVELDLANIVIAGNRIVGGDD